VAPPALQTLFRDRADAGRRLARRLLRYRDSGALVLALPRGGVPVGYEVARALRLGLDVLPVQHISTANGKVVMGALALGAFPCFGQTAPKM
jgi:putative phosphoribosyl transferase